MNIKETIPAQLNLVPGFITILLKKLEFLGMSEKNIFSVRLCLEEALVNAMRHGNKLNPDLPVEVALKAEDSRLTITVKDRGDGFDFHNLADPTVGDNLKKASGRGIFLIKNLMESVEFSDGGRTLTMVKSFKGEGDGEDNRGKM